MSDSLDPELSRALQEPARLVRAEPSLLDAVREGGVPVQRQLLRQSSEASRPEDRYASAALLAALFNDHGPLEQAARGYGATPPRELMALSDVSALRPALRTTLSSPVRTGLLEWATRPDPANPPLELAMAARDLQLEDAAVLRSVASRAEQVAHNSATPQQRDPLMRVAEVLRGAADAHAAPTETAPASQPSPQEPSATSWGSQQPPATTDPTDTTGPRVTTHGIPKSEMLREDELDQPDPYTNYPGTGVPVRDSLNGPRGVAPEDDAARTSPLPQNPEQPVPPQPVPPREPSTSELYYGVGSDRYAQHDPTSPESRAEDKNVLRNWGIVFLVIVAIICLLVLVL